tara:strand:+ start:1345 stop:1623 length:279 start_codon:yes stop_codon:yes gene_type:complete
MALSNYSSYLDSFYNKAKSSVSKAAKKKAEATEDVTNTANELMDTVGNISSSSPSPSSTFSTSGVGQIGGRKHRFGREQMVTGSASGTILAP